MIAAILLLTVFPVHYHLSHDLSEDVPHHHQHHGQHSVDFHPVIEKHDQLHHDEEHQAFSATLDGIVKKVGTVFIPFILFALLLVMLPVLTYRCSIRLGYNIIGPKQSYPHFSPPLRAPPVS